MDSEKSPSSTAHDPITITVVIPTFNRSALLSRAITSVMTQTYPHWRLVVVDNASPDDTSAVVTEVMRQDSRIHYHRHANNVGMLANWEFAISQVSSDYFSLLCDDDYLLPDFFQAAIREIKRHPDVGLCFGVTYVVDDDGNRLSVAPNEMETGYYPASVGAVTMMTLQHPATPAIVFRTACLNAVGGFDRGSLYVADLDMILRVAFEYPVMFFEEESACYVVHANNSFQDVQGWHPGLLHLVRNLKQMDGILPSHLAMVFGSFNKHAIVPLFFLILRYPKRKLNPGVFVGACRCLVEMRQVSATLKLLFANLIPHAGTFIKRIGLAVGRRLNALCSGNTPWLSRIAAFFSLDSSERDSRGQNVPGADGHEFESRALTALYSIALLVFLAVSTLFEFVLVHILDRPMVKSRALLDTVRPGLNRSK